METIGAVGITRAAPSCIDGPSADPPSAALLAGAFRLRREDFKPAARLEAFRIAAASRSMEALPSVCPSTAGILIQNLTPFHIMVLRFTAGSATVRDRIACV